RFSNDKTSSQTMSASAALMAAGANQQLVATKLEESSSVQGTDGSANNGNEGGSPAKPGDDSPKSDNGTLQIDHQPETEQTEPSAPSDTPSGPQTDQKSAAAAADATPSPLDLPEPQTEAITAPKAFGESATPHAGDHLSQGARLMTEPPTLGGALTANTLPEDEDLEASTDLLGLPKSEPGQLLSRDNSTPPAPPAPQKPPEQPVAPEPKPVTPSLTPPPSSWTPLPSSPPPAAPSPSQDQPADTGQHTLAELEESVHSPHLDTSSLNAARDEVTKALNDSSASTTPGPIQALNAQPLGDNLHPTAAAPNDAGQSLADTSLSTGPGSSSPVTPAPVLPTEPAVTAQPQVIDSTLPPPVPPPIPFQFGTPGAAPPQQQ
ncbi:MAG TPA: hypothetical protein VK712_00005, partial [Verrucomicrobiae bacterium]|nr:hypothetical protein [Verrucomicrobiae bacterium]